MPQFVYFAAAVAAALAAAVILLVAPVPPDMAQTFHFSSSRSGPMLS